MHTYTCTHEWSEEEEMYVGDNVQERVKEGGEMKI
jgi:hypothetical protein